MHDKIPMKEKVLQFVESKGSARYTEIQKFVVDHNKGVGAWEAGYQLNYVWLNTSKKNPEGLLSMGFPNKNRGYYSSAFSGPNPWFIYGKDYLQKQSDGSYKTVRDGNKPKPEYHSYWHPSINYPHPGRRYNNFRS
jgi:hypothetical protein